MNDPRFGPRPEVILRSRNRGAFYPIVDIIFTKIPKKGEDGENKSFKFLLSSPPPLLPPPLTNSIFNHSESRFLSFTPSPQRSSLYCKV